MPPQETTTTTTNEKPSARAETGALPPPDTANCPQSEPDVHPPNPLESTPAPGLWSRTFFLWAYPLLKLGKQRPLEDGDLSTLAFVDTSDYQQTHLQSIWRKEKARASPGRSPLLARALFWDYWKRTRRARWFLAGNMAARLIQTFALGKVLSLLESDDDAVPNNNKLEGYLWAALLVVCGMFAFPTKQQQFFETYRIGLQLRISLVASIYDKILRLPSVGGTGPATLLTSGHVTNLASNDVERFLSTAVTSNFIVLGPIEALVILGIGISIIGPVFCAGYALLCLLVPFQFWLSHRFASFRSRIAKETDARVGWVSQAVHGARIMKQSGFEDLFLGKITQQRSAEIRQLQTSARLKALNEAIYFVSSVVVAAVVFSVHVFALGGTLTPETVYTTLSLLNILQFTLTKHIPNAIMGLSECYVSCNRLQAFLDLPETEKTADHKSNEPQTLSMTNVTCYWDSDLLDPSHRPSEVALSNINLKCQSGKLYCVIGKIGSSKSALLQAISGELPSAKGTIKQQYRRIGYAAQEPWIMDGTIRENILLGLDLDQDWYGRVIDACALRHDLAQFSQGDGTIVGDRGVQCSGGQKARIGLARVFYKRDNQLLLLDDPLSAVDAKVARTIFFSAIQRLGVQRGLCIILVTHQHQFVGMADECILMDQGKITTTGTFADCMAASPDSIREVVTMQAETEEDRAVSEEHVAQIPDPKDKQNEKRVTGIVKLDIWTSYAKAFGGFPTCAAFLAIFVATQGTLLVTIVFLGKWGDAASVDQQSSKWFGIIGGTTAGLVTLSILRARLSFAILIRCSRKLHDQMARAVLRANICFFDTNPLGRILNRFSADVGIVDEALPLTVYDFLVGAFMFLGSVVTATAVLPYTLLVLPPLVLCFVRFRSVFVVTTRELKRLEGLARSPMYAMLSETMLGISTIRVNGSGAFFARKFRLAHDKHTRAAWAFMTSSRCFATSLELLSFLLLMTATLVSVLLHYQGWLKVDSATLGLALTLLIQMANTNFPWMVRQSAEVTNQMVSVERILEFGNLEPEAPLYLDSDANLDDDWPSDGNIDVKGLSVRYRPALPLALDDVDFSVEARSRVGVVGRTGSGKSTLVQALFRLLEPESGEITIDGVNIADVGLHRLRKSISVIPQVPTLFSGCTIRENLDLFGNHTERQVLDALGHAYLTDMVDSLPLGIHSMVSEGGSNFSVGQRQLLCLARAILSKNKLLVLDEATANVDRQTDQLLQESLQNSFRDGTILAVAHRLETIMNADRVLLMGNGRILEQGPPKELLQDSAGLFSAMAESGGYATTTTIGMFTSQS